MMFTKDRRHLMASGFTIMELLVVIAIIVMLVGILVPGMQGVSRRAHSLKQKAMFRGIEIGLGLFYEEYDGYPESTVVADTDAGGSKNEVCGAQHLTEVIMGRDERGFDPKSKFHGIDEPKNIYDSDDNTPEGQQSLARREEPYVELRDSGVYLFEQIYSTAVLAANAGQLMTGESDFGTGTKRAPVLTDVFDKRIDVGSIRRTGTPIVYFKANTSTRTYMEDNGTGTVDYSDTSDWVYNYDDNADVFNLPMINDDSQEHWFKVGCIDTKPDKVGKELFYETITNDKVSTFSKPYNANTYILMSAGWDGIFGTKDDVYNF